MYMKEAETTTRQIAAIEEHLAALEKQPVSGGITAVEEHIDCMCGPSGICTCNAKSFVSGLGRAFGALSTVEVARLTLAESPFVEQRDFDRWCNPRSPSLISHTPFDKQRINT